MNIQFSKQFQWAVYSAVPGLKINNNKIYLSYPFGGFYLSLLPPMDRNKVFKIFKPQELNVKEAGKIYLVCESLLGKEV
jgi:hypothetical protein